ncbi:hypothetical protein HID58_085206, partial [Brassica napus]
RSKQGVRKLHGWKLTLRPHNTPLWSATQHYVPSSLLHGLPVHNSPDHSSSVHSSRYNSSPVHSSPDHMSPDYNSPIHRSPAHKSPVHNSPDHSSSVHSSRYNSSPVHSSPDHMSPDYNSLIHRSPAHNSPLLKKGFVGGGGPVCYFLQEHEKKNKKAKNRHIWKKDVWKIMKKIESFLVLFMKLEPKT